MSSRGPTRRKPDRRHRALELLASAGAEGCTEAVMLANGIDVDTMVQIIVGGLATATPRRVGAGREVLEVTTLRITDVASARSRQRRHEAVHSRRSGALA
jgi:hypothetical protein